MDRRGEERRKGRAQEDGEREMEQEKEGWEVGAVEGRAQHQFSLKSLHVWKPGMPEELSVGDEDEPATVDPPACNKMRGDVQESRLLT
eukprot:763055-Hanusia_phi.AAC.1